MNGLSAHRDPVWLGVLGAVLLCLFLQAWIALVTEINWDEFFYLSHIYSHERGELAVALQKLQVHLFSWLTALPGDEIDRIEVARLVMLLCETATCFFLYRLARAFFDTLPSLLAVLAFVAAGFTMMHGASFRADPIATALIMLSLSTLARGRMAAGTALAIGASAAIAALVTVKVVFYAPAFAGIAAWRIAAADDRKQLLRWLALTGGAAALCFIGLYAFHASTLAATSNAAAEAMLANAGRTTIVEAGLLPRANEILRAALLAPVTTLLMLVGLVALLVRGSRPEERWARIAVLACAAPLLALLFYRNAFPYFFPFITAPASLLVAATVQNIELLRRRAILVAAPMLASALLIALMWSRERPQQAQQQMVAALHEIFPRPIAYIDRSSMISSFPKRGFFMSGWGMLNYQEGAPVFEGVLAAEPVPLLLLNSPALENAVGVGPALSPLYTLHPEDRRILSQNYIPHWGPLWVAGKRLSFGRGEMQIAVKVPGLYTVEGGPLTISGRELRAGDVVFLERGIHRLSAAPGTEVVLRWGDHLPRPDEAEPEGPAFRGF